MISSSPWVGNCVGIRNYRYFYGFVCFLWLECGLQLAGSIYHIAKYSKINGSSASTTFICHIHHTCILYAWRSMVPAHPYSFIIHVYYTHEYTLIIIMIFIIIVDLYVIHRIRITTLVVSSYSYTTVLIASSSYLYKCYRCRRVLLFGIQPYPRPLCCSRICRPHWTKSYHTGVLPRIAYRPSNQHPRGYSQSE